MNRVILCCCLTFVLLSSAHGTTIFFDDAAAWQSAAASDVALTFTAANVALADEVVSAPGPNDALGPVLTFPSSSTGYSFGFEIRTLELNAGFTFDDNEGDSDFNDSLSIGDINNFDNDDFRVDFAGTVFGFGFDLRDSDDGVGETFSVFGSGGLIASFDMIPGSAGADFVGVLSDEH